MEKQKADQPESRLLSKSLGEKPLESHEHKFEIGATLINTDLEKEDPATAEFTITEISEQEGRGIVYKLENPNYRSKALVIIKSERILKEEMERSKYRFKE